MNEPLSLPFWDAFKMLIIILDVLAYAHGLGVHTAKISAQCERVENHQEKGKR